jgi:hypothetical protein
MLLAAGAATLPAGSDGGTVELRAPLQVAGYMIMQGAVIDERGPTASVDIQPGGTVDGYGGFTGRLTNAGELTEDIYGSPGGFQIGGSFTNEPSGFLRLLPSRDMTVGRRAVIKGRVRLMNHYVEDQETVLSSRTVNWEPSCVGSVGKHQDMHWAVTVNQGPPHATIVLNWVPGVSPHC